MDGAKVITSREFDTVNRDDDCRADAAADTKNDDDGGTTTTTTCNGDVAEDEYNLITMYMIAGLIQSTHNYYRFSSDDTTPTSTNTTTTRTQSFNSSADSADAAADTAADVDPTSISNNTTPPSITMNQTILGGSDITTNNQNHNNRNSFNDEKFSEDNSEGLSSWTPSSKSSCRHLRHHHRHHFKTIDNDNRSDGQSSDMAKEESSSSSLDSLASTMDGDGECNSKIFDREPYSVIG